MVMQVLMSEPVMAADGCTYEKTALQTWLQDSLLSPVTGNMMEHTSIQQCHQALNSSHVITACCRLNVSSLIS